MRKDLILRSGTEDQVVSDFIRQASDGVELDTGALSRLRGFFRKRLDRFYRRSIDPTARIHSTAKLGRGVKVGPNSVIMAGALLGDGVNVGPNCIVGEGSCVGANTVLQDKVFIDHDVKVGPHCTFGDDFTSHPDSDCRYDHKIKVVRPGTKIGHSTSVLGKVYIGYDCEIDNGEIGECNSSTVIGDRCRFAFDVFAKGFIPPDTELLNSAAMVGSADGTTVHSSDWWSTSGLFSEGGLEG